MCVQGIFSPAEAIANPTDISSSTDMVTFHMIPHPCRLAAGVITV